MAMTLEEEQELAERLAAVNAKLDVLLERNAALIEDIKKLRAEKEGANK